MSGRLIDLSHSLGKHTPVYPGDEPVSLESVRSCVEDGYASYLLRTQLHAGTHIDTPGHMLLDGEYAGIMRVQQFIGRGVLLPMRGQRVCGVDARFDSMVRPGDIVLLHTGWDEHYFDECYFTQHPVINEALVEFLIERRISVLGMDTPSPDQAPYTLHKRLLAAGICTLENLTNLSALEGADSFEVMALPLKLEAEASPVRAVARVTG